MDVLSRSAVLLLLSLCGAFAEEACIQQTISSNGHRYNRVTIPNAYEVTRVTVLQKHSRSSCTLGNSFGIIGPDVYVDKGCRATFQICYEIGTTIRQSCDSNDYRENRCDTGALIRKLTLARQNSRSDCVQGSSYYRQGNFIVVNNGCRAEFLVGR